MVLQLAPYLVDVGYFETAKVIFQVVGHTRNPYDWLFNLAKVTICNSTLFLMEKLIAVCSVSVLVSAKMVFETTFFTMSAKTSCTVD